MTRNNARTGISAFAAGIAAAVGLAMLTGSPAPAMADGLPGMRGHDHTGITVPDMNQAVSFFTDVLGCQKACLSVRSPTTRERS